MSPSSPVILDRIHGRVRDLGGFSVKRVLPIAHRKLIGPFVFLDEMGPAQFAPGGGIDVRPHPHIGLATVTYLFEGRIRHRDSLGFLQDIVPGDVNWMTAGRGIVHSERGLPAERDREKPIYGMQTWLALPDGREEIDPAFEAVTDLPLIEDSCASARVIMGSLWGRTASTTQHSPTIYAEIMLAPGGAIPLDADAEERAVMLVGGEASVDGQPLGLYTLAVLAPGAVMRLSSEHGGRIMLLGGAALDSPRHVWWNFVSSSRERINQAKDDWRDGRFGKVPGDEDEFIPIPQVPLTNSDTGREK